MSPSYWNGSYLYAYMFFVYGSTSPGYLNIINVYGSDGVIRPVISLKSTVMWVRKDGNPNAPFEWNCQQVKKIAT